MSELDRSGASLWRSGFPLTGNLNIRGLLVSFLALITVAKDTFLATGSCQTLQRKGLVVPRMYL